MEFQYFLIALASKNTRWIRKKSTTWKQLDWCCCKIAWRFSKECWKLKEQAQHAAPTTSWCEYGEHFEYLHLSGKHRIPMRRKNCSLWSASSKICRKCFKGEGHQWQIQQRQNFKRHVKRNVRESCKSQPNRLNLAHPQQLLLKSKEIPQNENS